MVGLFLAASALMIWRLEAMSGRGLEGTVLGTLVMPYCSGIGNLLFLLVVGSGEEASKQVITNCLVNNATNLTLLIGLPAILWGLIIAPRGKAKKKEIQSFKINRLSLALSMIAALFFTGATWALARDGKLETGDGLVLVGLFLFWQCFHVYDVLKHNVRHDKSFHPIIILDFALLLIGAYGVYLSLEWLVGWLSQIETGFVSARHLGWLSGWLMVIPNAMLAVYYAWRKRPEVVFASQVGDGHICIPLSIGLYAIFHPMVLPDFFTLGIQIISAAIVVHLFLLLVFGGLPRFVGVGLLALYGWFIYKGLI